MTFKRTGLAVALSGVLAIGLALPAYSQISDDKVVIGFITDMSSLYSDLDGAGGAEAIKMAIEDFGGEVNGKKIELYTADHQNKADIAANKVREWIDEQGADFIIGGTNSAAELALAKIAANKRVPAVVVGAGTAQLTNEECSPYTMHYVYDTVALSRVAGSAVVKSGGDSWYFLTVDYAFGDSLQNETAEVVKKNGGTVVGNVHHPLSAADFSSYMLQAQASKAKILGLANSGGDTINSIKAANEFGVTNTMQLAGLLVFINDIHALGLDMTQGMYVTTGWYWDLNEETRAWSKRYYEKMKKQPSMAQAGDYSAALTYLKAVQAIGTDDPDKVVAQMKSEKINDMFTKNGVIRPDGRMVHDMYLMQVKSPSESKYPWDYYKLISVVPGDEAYTTRSESKCQYWK